MRLLMETMRNMINPLVRLMGVLFIVFYMFSTLGIYIFGGTKMTDFPSIV